MKKAPLTDEEVDALFADINQKIGKAKTLDDLKTLENVVKELEEKGHGTGRERRLLLSAITEKRRTIGVYLEDAKVLYSLKKGIDPSSAPDKKELIDLVFRENTPTFYQYLIDAAVEDTTFEAKHISTNSIQSNPNVPKGEMDMFMRRMDPRRVHLFPDSRTFGLAWGHMAEGATGKIKMDDGPEKNLRRAHIMMGRTGTEKNTCLRYDIHNFLRLNAGHRVYFDSNPQVILLPLFDSLQKLKDWDGKEPYEVLVLVHSKEGLQDAQFVYSEMLPPELWSDFNPESDQCLASEKKDAGQMSGAFKMLRHFISALACSLLEEIPQSLLGLQAPKNTRNTKNTKRKKSGSKGRKEGLPPPSPSTSGRNSPAAAALVGDDEDQSLQSNGSQSGSHAGKSSPTASVGEQAREYATKKDEVDETLKVLQEYMKTHAGKLPLPYFEENDTKKVGFRPVLKMKIEAQLTTDGHTKFAADPWLLMVKAAVNFSYLAYGFKLLPACPPHADEAADDYYEAALAFEERQRQHDAIPTTLTIPSTPVGGDRAPPVTPLPNIGGGHAATVTPPRKGTNEEDDDQSWESLSDASY